ncbi:MAG: Regulatory protein SoxS [Candidatus Ordinivivax streblomastigis]|uniref:Regulatory protein SoxS n=1 Tax=Candidatus Ordinivivax streblomastigis TaxID=2540710 RepID=A0A5M8NXR9_9BACT|nr:MAG: Regulatory protein SoxS [Candidatus Ordinivivax streblomastigis]
MRNSTESIYRQKVNQVINYISVHLHQPLQLDVLAEHINVSQRALLRIARSVLNEPLSAYVTRQRIERAVMYMQTEEMSLTTLAGTVALTIPNRFQKPLKNSLEYHRRPI